MPETPPDKLSREQLRQRIIRRAQWVFEESEQAIIDGDYWNGLPHNQQHTPIDLERFRIHRAHALEVLKQFGITPKSRL